MKTALTFDDHALLKGPDDIFDVESAYVEWVETAHKDDRRGVFHPSAVGGCARRNVYEYIGTPRMHTTEAKDLEVFRIGHAIHGLIQGAFHDLKRVLEPKGVTVKFADEVPYDPAMDTLFLDIGIGGTTDGIIELESVSEGWKQRGILEVKSIKDKNFNKLTGPKHEHRMQANLYAFRFDCPLIYFWYYNKDSSDRKVYRQAADPKVLDEALKRFTDQRAHADAGTLPEREESFYICPRCEYAHVCKPATLDHVNNKKALNVLSMKGFGRR